MAIVGIVVIIAGEAFSNSTKVRVRTDNMIRANQDAENIATIFKDDVEQLGTKSAKGAGNTFTSASKRIFIDPDNADANKKDLSSFRITKDEDGFSNLTFKRTRYSDNGEYQAIDSIQWYVEDNILKRNCTTIAAATGFTLPADDPCVGENAEPAPINMASNVTLFDIEAARPGTTEDRTKKFPTDGTDQFILYPRLDASGEYERSFVAFSSTNESNEMLQASNSITLSGFWSNYQNVEDNLDNAILNEGEQKVNQAIAINSTESFDSDWRSLCLAGGAMMLSPDTVYEISFEVTSQSSKDRSVTFVPGKDHMSVGFRIPSTGSYPKAKNEPHNVILPDFLFYPPLDNNMGDGAGIRTMRFTVPERIENACLAFTFAFYSPLVATGRVTIKNLQVNQVASANYKFDGFESESTDNIKEKKNVKAMKLKLQISRGAKNGGKGETGDINLVIPIPSNGTGD